MIALVDLHDEHPIPFEAELIRAGLRWRDFPNPGFTWRDLYVIVQTLDRDGPLNLALHPQDAADVTDRFLRSMEHSLRWLVWSKTSQARSGRPPEQWRFVWEDDEDNGYRTDSLTPAQVNDFLGWNDLIEAENRKRAAEGRPLLPT